MTEHRAPYNGEPAGRSMGPCPVCGWPLLVKSECDKPAEAGARSVTEERVTGPGSAGAARSLVLSLFPGVDMLGRGFEAEGFCIVRGPDVLWGGDVRRFHPPPHVFDGIIGGPPCQDYSAARRSAPTGEGDELLAEFRRAVTEARPDWFLMENVPRVPDLDVPGYHIQRLDLDARECGATQSRRRHFQFGCVRDQALVPERCTVTGAAEPCCLASEGEKTSRRAWPDFCAAQGLPRDFDLPGLSVAAKYRAVGNGVHVAVARVLARAVRAALLRTEAVTICVCGCGRPVTGKQRAATPACRKRMERRRRRDTSIPESRHPVTGSAVTDLAPASAGLSQCQRPERSASSAAPTTLSGGVAARMAQPASIRSST